MKTIVYGLNEAKMRRMLELMAQEVESIITATKREEKTRASLERGDLTVMITDSIIEPIPTIPEEGMTLGIALGIAFEEMLNMEDETEALPQVFEASRFITHLIQLHVTNAFKKQVAIAEIKDEVMN